MGQSGKRAVVIGAGPNGLAAACVLARSGVQVEVLEASNAIGGGARTEELTLPGFLHDVGSSVYPMGIASPVFRSMPLEQFGLRWIEPEIALAHPLEDGTAVALRHEVEHMADELGAEDGAAWAKLFGPLADAWPKLIEDLLGPVVHVPRHPLLLAQFGARAVLPAVVLARTLFRGERARALFAGLAGHSVRPLESPVSGAFGLVLGIGAHARHTGIGGWPVAQGGGGAITAALARYLESLGGVIRTGVRVERMADVPRADAVVCDVSPRALVSIAGEAMQSGNRRLLERYEYGPGSFKVDWALGEPIPWTAPACRVAGTVHVGGTMEEIARSERAPFRGTVDDQPFALVTQPSVCDPTRAPAGQHVAWGYCHVPNGWTGDALERIERQMERFAPGFRDCVLARRVWSCGALEAWNANLVGGDLSGGAMSPLQLVMRPTPRLYETSVPGWFLGSSSTPPGGGVHGMAGFHAAEAALRFLRD